MEIEHIKHLPNTRVLVIGDVMLDRYWHGATSRISPEAPVPVVKVCGDEDRPGGAANVAVNSSALGAYVKLFGFIGNDPAGEILSNNVVEKGVNPYLEVIEKKPTIIKLRVLSRNQQLIRLDFETGFHDVEQTHLLKSYQQALADVDVVIFSDYGKGLFCNPHPYIQAARALNKPIIVDPKTKDFSLYPNVTLLTPNQKEFEAVVGPCKNEQDFYDKGMPLIERYGWDALLVTRGEDGMTLLRQGEAALHFSAQAREVYDVTGAGDTVIATLAAALGAGLSISDASRLANIAAGRVVEKIGTASITLAELLSSLHMSVHANKKVVQTSELKFICEAARQRGEKIVMTNGCFDILHAGHISYLEQAKALGERLIVAVNSDASVKQLKGPSRPMNTLEHRMAVLAGLKSIDWLVPFSEQTPEQLINELLPDILVKGGDYQVHEIAGGKAVIANGGQVIILDFVEGCSTTNLIEKIRRDQQEVTEVSL